MNWPEFLKRVLLRPSFPLSLEFREYRGEKQIVGLLKAPDIHSGEMQTVHVAYPVPERFPDDDRAAISMVRGILRETLEHELDECLMLDGVQVHDPHTARRWSYAVPVPRDPRD